jgi:hypothetical protein
LKRPVTIPQSSSDQVGAKGRLLHDHAQIEQTVAVKIGHLKFEGRGRADNGSSESKVSVSRKHTHAV